MAIKNTVRRIESDRFNNGFSSSCEEDVEGDDEEEDTTTDREVEGPSSSALEEGDWSKFSTVIRRRARSEGTNLDILQSEPGKEEQQHAEQRSVFPVLSQLSGMSDRQSDRESSLSQTFANIPSFSSYPSIKCDIVEYL